MFKGAVSQFRSLMDWPMLHTRIITYFYLGFAFYQLNELRITNSDSSIARMMADGFMTGLLFVIGFYVLGKPAAEAILGIVAKRFGVDYQPSQKTKITQTKVEQTNVESTVQQGQ